MKKSDPALRWINRLAILLLAVKAYVFIVAPVVFPWSAVNCWEDEIDIHSGRIRHRRYILYCCVSQAIRDSPLTEVLDGSIELTRNPEWHTVNTFSPVARYSPHYRYHGAINDMRNLEISSDIGRFSEDAKKATAIELLGHWQVGDDPAAYLTSLGRIAMKKCDRGESVEVSDLRSTTPSSAPPAPVRPSSDRES
jgi:hypothetical protein